ncbi:phage portal protein [Enterococcus faecium]|nr:phage portal protein [Enterococcus faecium]
MGIFQKAVGYFTKKATVPLEEYFCKLQVDFVYRKFAIETCIDLIANAMSKAEFKSYEDGKNKKNDLYYRLNVAPNKKNNETFLVQCLYSVYCWRWWDRIVSPSNNSSEIFIADSWDVTEYALKDDVFSQVQINNIVLDREFLESDVIYIKYADQQIRQLVDAYYQAYGKLISSAMNVYKRSNARRYVLKGNLFRPQDNTTQDQINKMMTSQFKAFMEADNAGAVFQLQNEYTLEDFSGNFQSNSRDIKNLIDDIFEMTAAAFHVPKNLLKGDMSGLSDQVDAFLMFEIIPIAELIQDAFNASLYEVEEYLSGNFVRVDTTMIKITSFKDLVDAIDVGIRNGVFTINEGRERVGNDRSDKAMADEIFITKNNQQVSKGGEANDDNENISSSKE